MVPDTIPALVEHAARAYGDREAVVDGEVRWSFAELRDQVRRVARAAMARGIRPGDRVAIWAPNSKEWITAALGLTSAGAVLVPLNTRYKAAEAADIMRRSGCVALFTVAGFLGLDYPAMLADSGEALPDLIHTVRLDGPAWAGFLRTGEAVGDAELDARIAGVSADDLGDVIYTSGTTGRAKGVLTTHGQTVSVFRTWTETAGLRPGDRYLLVNPFFHTFGYKAGVLACLHGGATMVPEPVFDPSRVGARLLDEKITVLTGPPTVFFTLLGSGLPGHVLRLAGTGAANVPVDLIRRIREELGVPAVFTGYGLSESCGVVSMCPPDADAETVAHTTGPALPGTEVRIVATTDGSPLPAGEEGEICVRGYNVMRGYLDDPAATAQAIDRDGWLHTGDIGRLDDRGYVTVTDRLKDMFVVGGFNAYPAEIEGVLVSHPEIGDAAVIGVPDERLGEVGAAFLVTPETLDTEELTRWLRERLANFKVPRTFQIVTSLPRNAGGKVLKHELRSGL